MTSNSKIAGISTGPATHLDHLGVLCSILDIPLMVTEEASLSLANDFYPSLSCHLVEHSRMTLEFLAEHLDVILECGKFWAAELVPLLQLLYGKKMRIVFCPHGNSDKGHTISPEIEHASQDIALFYGDHMYELLKKSGALAKIKQTIKTGNYRLLYYLKHKNFYDQIVKNQISSKLNPSLKNILYTPTWSDRENVSSFLELCADAIHQLSPDYNLIIKLHPFLEEHYPAQIYYLQNLHSRTDHVHFIDHFPPIYPLLAISDIYLGDYSSIGYDFLAFDRPLYFYESSNKNPNNQSYLHQCGVKIPAQQTKNLKKFLGETLPYNKTKLAAKRSEVYQHAFGNIKELDTLKNELLGVLNP